MRVLNNIISLLFLFCVITSLPVEDNVVLSKYMSENDEINNESGDSNINLAPGQTSRGAGVLREDLRWPNGTVPYRIDGFSETEQEIIKQAMRTLEYWTCIRFVPHDPATIQSNYIVIEDGPSECGSDLGYIGSIQHLYLTSPKCFEKVGLVLHQLLHALGLVDENNRPDRDQYITVNYHNIHPDRYPFFGKYEPSTADNFSIPYDYNSIMHYSKHMLTLNNQTTIEPKVADVEIGQREGLSARDIMTIMKMYNCSNPGFDFSNTEHSSPYLPNFREILPRREMLYRIIMDIRNMTFTD